MTEDLYPLCPVACLEQHDSEPICLDTKFYAHLELGAANFGPYGHTKEGLNKTVIKEINVAAPGNYIERLEDKIDYCPHHYQQFFVLFRTMNDIINKNKDYTIVFHVNDIDDENTDYVTNILKDRAKECHCDNIIIEGVPGNYTLLSPKQSLAKYNLSIYNTVHLKNPDESFFHDQLAPEATYSLFSINRGIDNLLKIASYAYKAILFDTLSGCIPFIAYTIMLTQGILKRSDNHPFAYIFPEGDTIWPLDRAVALEVKIPSTRKIIADN